MNLLYNSSEVNRLFNYFENAKMLNKKELLDDEYLYNFFITTVYGLVKATGPTLEDYMKKLRGVKPNGDSEFYNDYNPATWDGFEYCLENIFIPQLYKNINEKENQGSEKKMFQDLKACYNKLVEMYGNGKLIEYSY